MTHESETYLTGEDAMAHNFLTRAANAIVSASDLSRKLDALTDSLNHANDAMAILEDIKRTQEDRIASLEAQLQNSLNAESIARSNAAAWEQTTRERQADIDLLDSTVASLRSELAATRTERDDFGLKHLEAVDALEATQTKLDAIVGAMRKVGFNVSQFEEPEPEPTHADYAEEHPDYRAEPTPSEEKPYFGEPSAFQPPQPPSEDGMVETREPEPDSNRILALDSPHW